MYIPGIARGGYLKVSREAGKVGRAGFKMADRVVTEEPLPGWQRVEVAGSTPLYKSPFPRTVITSNAKLKEFLRKENAAGRLLGINAEQFSFKRRLGLRQRSSSSTDEPNLELFQADDGSAGDFPGNHVDIPVNKAGGDASGNRDGDPLANVAGVTPANGATALESSKRGVVELLSRDPEVDLDHRKLLSNEAKKIDNFRPKDAYESPANFEEWKQKIADAADLKEVFTLVSEESKVNDGLAVLFSDIILAEVSQINSNCGPMEEFPPSVNENIYCRVSLYIF